LRIQNELLLNLIRYHIQLILSNKVFTYHHKEQISMFALINCIKIDNL